MCSRICSQVRGSTRPSRYSERLANRSRHSAGRCVPLARAAFGLACGEALTVLGCSGTASEQLAHLLAHAQTCPMEANPHRSRLQSENLRHLLGLQLLHVVEHEDNAQLDRDAQDCLVQQMVLLGVEQIAFRTLPRRPASNLPSSVSSGINSSSDSMCLGA